MIKIRVPASSANVGPGFDSLGFAINLYNEFIIEKINDGIETNIIDRTAGQSSILSEEDNLFYHSLKRIYGRAGRNIDGLKLTEIINIPLARGLGSSASAVIAGLVAGNYLMGNIFSEEEIIDLAIDIEGHPDNILPAYKGGLIISVISDNEVIYKKISLAEDIKFVFIIPDFKLKTEELRRVLPASVSLQDAVFNLGRTALLTASLMEKDLGILKVALEDRLHQDYRAELIPGFYNIIETAYQHGACGVCLSGSGPTIMAVADKDEEMIGRAVVNEFKKHGISSTYIVKRADNCGCKIIED